MLCGTLCASNQMWSWRRLPRNSPEQGVRSRSSWTGRARARVFQRYVHTNAFSESNCSLAAVHGAKMASTSRRTAAAIAVASAVAAAALYYAPAVYLKELSVDSVTERAFHRSTNREVLLQSESFQRTPPAFLRAGLRRMLKRRKYGDLDGAVSASARSIAALRALETERGEQALFKASSSARASVATPCAVALPCARRADLPPPALPQDPFAEDFAGPEAMCACERLNTQ